MKYGMQSDTKMSGSGPRREGSPVLPAYVPHEGWLLHPPHQERRKLPCWNSHYAMPAIASPSWRASASGLPQT